MDVPVSRRLVPEPPAITRMSLPRSRGVREAEGLGPELLRVGPRLDLAVGEVDGRTIYRSQVFDRMLESDTLQAASWIDTVLLDQAIAALADDQQVELEPDRVEAEIAEVEELLRAQVALERGELQVTDEEFEQFLAARFGISLDGYREVVRRDVARQQLRDLTVRLIGWREPRVTVRCLFTRDRSLCEEARDRVLEGASLQALAERLRQDHEGVESPKLGPFGSEFQHPVAEQALGMRVGQVSDVLELSSGRFGIVQCLERTEAREEPFEALAAELWADLEDRPIEDFERRAFALRYGGYETPLPGGSEGR